MNTITTLKMALVLLMLCSGLIDVTFATQRLRFFGELQNKTTWEEASACKDRNASLVTLYDEEDAKFMYKFTENAETQGDTRTVWLGLRYVGNYTWSNGEAVTFTEISEELNEEEQQCVAIHDDKWKSFNCSENKHFMCSKGNNYTLVNSAKTWCQALQHCRDHHTELVSINSTAQNEEVINEGNGESFWIGLRHDEWKWDDDGCSSFREWKPNAGNIIKGNCTQIGLNSASQSVQLYRQTCSTPREYLCAKGHVRIKVIEQKLTWEEAYKYCKVNYSRLLWIEDGNDQEAVEQWLNHTNVDGPFWICLRQSRVFGFWIWSDSLVGYSKWKGDEPQPPLSQQCGVIDKEDKMWRDENCQHKLPFLCEEDIIYMSDMDSNGT
ncbi:macrophage mannose receptor 1-like [Notolabrus celidotus]|uniref:macrophage mannose receptor 1-like n=1 Tax=Notolabrus celidotus TaxID=1203425 RepID=UPI00148F5D9E|nr:macrophage mannose receptor 1-like [Notolabrus celidotus]